MPTNWSAMFERMAHPALPLLVRAATLENEALYVGDQERWHFNTSAAWRLRDRSSLVAAWTWPNASDLIWELCGHQLVAITLQNDRTPIDPVLVFDNDWSHEVFSDYYLDPRTIHLPTGVLVGDGAL